MATVFTDSNKSGCAHVSRQQDVSSKKPAKRGGMGAGRQMCGLPRSTNAWASCIGVTSMEDVDVCAR